MGLGLCKWSVRSMSDSGDRHAGSCVFWCCTHIGSSSVPGSVFVAVWKTCRAMECAYRATTRKISCSDAHDYELQSLCNNKGGKGTANSSRVERDTGRKCLPKAA